MGADSRFVRSGILILSLLAGGSELAHATSQPRESATAHVSAQETFEAPEQAVTALIDSLRNDDKAAQAAVLGKGSERVISSGDPYSDQIQLHKFLGEYDEKHRLVQGGADHLTLHVGPNDWPLPIPLVKTGTGWRFDTEAGAQEIINRRIGRNEIGAVRACLAYVDAQKDYFDLLEEATGQGAYARQLVSRPGNYDGLYWPPADGIPPSPLEPLVSRAIEEGYPGEIVTGKRTPYYGYFFRILSAQGPNAPEGARNYVQNGKMTGGFALLAWPATYGNSGIMTFQVNQDGIVFQRDLGPQTPQRVNEITRFDPDLGWARIDITAD